MKKEQKTTLYIYLLNQPVLRTEWYSLLGSKYRHAFTFPWEITDSLEKANVVAWDGILTPKLSERMDELNETLKCKVLLFVGEPWTLYRNNPDVKIVDCEQYDCVRLNNWTILPEELLTALENCYQKLNHV